MIDKAIQYFKNLLSDPNLDAKLRRDLEESLKRTEENKQVFELFAVLENSPDERLNTRTFFLVNRFMVERREMLRKEEKPHSYGTPAEFKSWLSEKPAFKKDKPIFE